MGFNNYYPALIFMKGDAKIKKPLNDVMSVSTSSQEAKQKMHPYQKDIRFVSKLIETCSTYEDTILDPFMGSGTTGVACKNLSRNFIGIEIDKKYYDIATTRISQEGETIG